MTFLTVLRWVGACLSAFGGLVLVAGVFRARAAGHRTPMHRGQLALGVASLLICTGVLLPRDAEILKVITTWLAAGCCLAGARITRGAPVVADAGAPK